jgi:hypothetical protein
MVRALERLIATAARRWRWRWRRAHVQRACQQHSYLPRAGRGRAVLAATKGRARVHCNLNAARTTVGACTATALRHGEVYMLAALCWC